MRFVTSLLLAVSACLAALPSQAATIVRDVEYKGQVYWAGGIFSPRDEINLKFTVEFDPSSSFDNTQQGLTVRSFDLAAPLYYSWRADTGWLVIGSDTTRNGYAVQGGRETFGVSIFGGFTDNLTPSAAGSMYSLDGVPVVWTSRIDTVQVTKGLPAVPEPATWALMIVGFGVVGSALRRRAGYVTSPALA